MSLLKGLVFGEGSEGSEGSSIGSQYAAAGYRGLFE